MTVRLAIVLMLVSGPALASTTTTSSSTTTTTVPHLILGKSFVVKDPQPGADPALRKIIALGKEVASADSIDGDPLANGATLAIVANGTTSTNQLFVLPAGAAVSGSPGWKTLGNPVIGYSYKDSGGVNGPVLSVLMKKTPGGTFLLKAKVKAALGPGPQPHVIVVPPAPGTDGGMAFSINGGSTYCIAFGGPAGGGVTNAPSSTQDKLFKISSTASAPTTEAGCPTPAPVWQASVGANDVEMSPLRDGSLLVTGYGGQGTKLDPATGTVLGTIPVPDVRNAIYASADPRDLIVGGYQGRQGYWSDGTLAWDEPGIGCCNLPRIQFGADTVEGNGYFAANGGLNIYDLTNGMNSGTLSGLGLGWAAVVDSTTLYVAWKQLFAPGEGVARLTRSGPSTWSVAWNVSVDAANNKLPGPPAIAADGSVVVGTAGDHLGNFDSGYPFLTMSPGRLAHVATDGTVLWDIDPHTVTPPVISADGLVFIGTQTPNQGGGPNGLDLTGPGSIEAYDLDDGTLAWSQPISGLPTDLLVADDGLLYAVTAGGILAQFDQSTGAAGFPITGLPGAGDLQTEAILHDGRVFVSGGGKVVAFAVQAQDYDPNSPWPVRFHDNQHTADFRTTP